jgi:dipeptidase
MEGQIEGIAVMAKDENDHEVQLLDLLDEERLHDDRHGVELDIKLLESIKNEEPTMKKSIELGFAWILWTGLGIVSHAHACTSILVSKGATKDGSVIITYSCDGEFLPSLTYTAAADHDPNEFIEIKDRSGKVRGQIKQVSHTFAVVGLMNEFQLSIGETTFDGREELRNPEGLLHYWMLMNLALQRAKTAREAILVMADLVEEYGYASTGESFSIADPKEAWIMEMIGVGPGRKGAVWVARRIPDGMLCAHANMSRIGTFPTHDSKNCLYAGNVESFAAEKGYFDPKSGKPFHFQEAYDPQTPEKLRYSAGRVWSVFRRSAPSLNLSSDFQRGVEGADPYPLWIKPDRSLALEDIIALMRDHYEGTPFDMTQGVDAGPFGSPNRWRPIAWEIDSVHCVWERPISTQQTGFSFISQARSWLPDPIGGVYWYGVDDTYTTCYAPFYCGISSIPEAYAVGDLQKFSWDSAWWVFNFVANIANLKYSYMIKDILKIQNHLEGELMALQPAIDMTANALYNSNRDLMARFLTDYSLSHAEQVFKAWQDLGGSLLNKYNDGYVKDEKGRPQEVGYPQNWLREVIGKRGDSFRLPLWEKNEK